MGHKLYYKKTNQFSFVITFIFVVMFTSFAMAERDCQLSIGRFLERQYAISSEKYYATPRFEYSLEEQVFTLENARKRLPRVVSSILNLSAFNYIDQLSLRSPVESGESNLSVLQDSVIKAFEIDGLDSKGKKEKVRFVFSNFHKQRVKVLKVWQRARSKTEIEVGVVIRMKRTINLTTQAMLESILPHPPEFQAIGIVFKKRYISDWRYVPYSLEISSSDISQDDLEKHIHGVYLPSVIIRQNDVYHFPMTTSYRVQYPF